MSVVDHSGWVKGLCKELRQGSMDESRGIVFGSEINKD